MDLDQMDLEQLEQYQADLRRLNSELVSAAASGRFRAAGRTFTRLLQVQHAAGMLPGRDRLAEIEAELNSIPSRVLGVRHG
jgi:hypothetical protein